MRTYRKIDSVDAKTLAFLQAHRDRLGTVMPDGMWGCYDGDEPLLILTVYTAPEVRVSLLGGSMDGPGKHGASIARLAQEFEDWCRPLGVTAYRVVVPSSDVEYRRMLERRGAVEIGRGGGSVEYLHRIDVEHDTSDGIRSCTAQDWRALRPLVRAFLLDNYAIGGDPLPSRRNTERLIQQGVAAAYRGEPVLVAFAGGALIGFVLWLESISALELRERTLTGVGIYVAPEHRRQGWSRRLNEAAKEAAKAAGYTKVIGVSLDRRGHAASTAAGYVTAGVIVHLTTDEQRKEMVA